METNKASQYAVSPSSLQPKTAKGRRKRERLLSAARKVFATRGFLDARVSDIAQEAGVSIGNFYQYFPDKDEMLGVLLQHFAEELFNSSSRAGVPRDDPYQTLEHATHGLFEVYARNADLYKILMQVVQVDGKYAQMWAEMRRPFVRRVYHLLMHVPEFQRTGINPKYAATALGSMATQSAYLWLVRGWDLDGQPMKLDDAVKTITFLWYRAMYGTDPAAELKLNSRTSRRRPGAGGSAPRGAKTNGPGRTNGSARKPAGNRKEK